MHSAYLFVILTLLFLSLPYVHSVCNNATLVPMPNNITCGKQNVTIKDPCRILYRINMPTNTARGHFIEILTHLQHKTFACQIPNIHFKKAQPVKLLGFQYYISASIQNGDLKSVFTTKDEAYKVNVTATQAIIIATTYVGYLRGLQSVLQLIVCPRFSKKQCRLSFLPIHIIDEPLFSYRSLMIDTARHYLPTAQIYQTIDALLYNKMSILHWHLVDEDSFPIVLQSHPQIAQYAAFSPNQTYSTTQLRQIVRYAMVRGVRIIPELDTPGHAASWGWAPQNKGVACTFSGSVLPTKGFMGPLDVTLDKTYQLIKQVFAEIIDIFPDPILHLGGDEVSLTCLANRTKFVEKEQIVDRGIEERYRENQREIIRQLSPNKIAMYWFNNNDIKLQQNDIVHWWGSGLPTTKNPVVMSQYGQLYLDMGNGNYLGAQYGMHATWLQLHNQHFGKMIQRYVNRKNVLGAEVCLWSQLSNRYTHHTKIWIRTSAFAEQCWTPTQLNAKPQALGRLAKHEQLMNRRGIPTSPCTSQQCQTYPQFC